MASSVVVDISPFIYDTFPTNGLVGFIAKRGSGKSVYCSYLASQLEFVQNGMVMVIAGSEKVRNDWGEYVHPLYIHPPSTQVLQKAIDDQNAIISKYAKSGKELPALLHKTIICDDTASLNAFMKSTQMRYIASNSRHLHMCVIVITQYAIQLSREFRSQLDLVVVMGRHTSRGIKSLYDDYCSSHYDIRTFKAVYSALTRNFGAMIIDARSGSEHILTFDKSPYPLPDDIKLGSPITWNFARQHYLDMHNLSSAGSSKLDDVIDDDEEQDEKEQESILQELAANRFVVHDNKGQILILKKSQYNQQKLKCD
jgi:hypothetical protein